jgi:glycosyltransferase involved in cell wall biosynthesis
MIGNSITSKPLLTICIPVFNYDVFKLVDCLNKEILTKTLNAEIILIDDNSDDVFNKINSELKFESAHIIWLKQNIGRAAIRNLFLEYASSDNLLFLDCDSEIFNNFFLENYANEIKKGYSVVCGGRIYPQQEPPGNRLLHWRYGVKRESKNFKIRNKQPYYSFMTNNFLIKRNIFHDIRFNENIRSYGHEDTLFGYELYKSKVGVRHIDSAVMHGYIETNKEFLAKSRSSILNLIQILHMIGYEKDFIESVTLLRIYFRLEKIKLDGLFYLISTPLIKLITRLLQHNIVRLWMFDLLKLCLFVNFYKNKKTRFK